MWTEADSLASFKGVFLASHLKGPPHQPLLPPPGRTAPPRLGSSKRGAHPPSGSPWTSKLTMMVSNPQVLVAVQV